VTNFLSAMKYTKLHTSALYAKPCALCLQTDIAKLFETVDVNQEPVTIYICKTCLSILPKYSHNLSDEELQKSNESGIEYYFSANKKQWDCDAVNLEAMVDFFDDLLGDKAKSIIGEIGAGRGCLLAALRSRGYTVKGCEPTSLADLSRAHFGFSDEELLKCPIDVLAMNNPGTFTSLFAWHLFEHVPSPLTAFSSAYTMLKSEGHLILQIPTLRVEELHQQHLIFFSQQSFEYVCRKVGFSIVSVFYDYHNRFMTVILRK
jgi:2-polyprenyl-3-methyl-5-hydroxy-6-metoxy-1,4-benzoquinol methylase